jgi:hypothetical protein
MRSSLCLALITVACGSAALAQNDAGRRWPVPDITAPTTELALELYVSISPAVVVGPSDHGTRQFIPITGGRFSGANGLQGEVMAGGADWQLRRPDGVTEVKAIYSIKTDDGVVIEVDNRGVIVPPAAGGAPYVRTTPRFHAPQGPYDWLNKTSFVGTITPAPQGGAVIIRAFKVL